ncbi:hypothetical protein HGRIS_006263 [Hohenbuehelia grisea]|uniref:N-acetyltransferase domain-containing protein n=1 Tax=Hohenbuehelia grisea TaxID=104357 RepID=A0ABR3K0J3_9AGAR
MRMLEVEVGYPGLGHPIATLTGVLINRHACLGQFFSIMDAESQELLDFAVGLFDNHLKLRPWLKNEGPHRGTSCWGTELERGNLLYVQEIQVKEKFRHLGVGSWTLQKLCASKYVKKDDYIYCWPAPIVTGYHHSLGSNSTELKQLSNFFRKNNFRRIGLTQFFAYSPNKDHPSRRISPSDDVDPSKTWVDPIPAGLNISLFDPVAAQALRETQDARIKKYYLHVAIEEDKTKAIISTITKFHSQDPDCIHVQDDFGFFPVHIAVMSENYDALKTLVSLGIRDALDSRDNTRNLTPREILSKNLLRQRDKTDIDLQPWGGYRRTLLLMRVLMKRAMGEVVEMPDDDYVLKKKWGCTCDQCLEGWLSPRMSYRLKAEAESMAEHLASITAGKNPQELVPVGVIQMSGALSHIPKKYWKSLQYIFATGYRVILLAIAGSLTKGLVPSVPCVFNRLSDVPEDRLAAKHFLQRGSGGTVDRALDCIVFLARLGAFAAGNKYDRWEGEMRIDGSSSSEAATAWRALPTCTNDLEFRMVRDRLPLGHKIDGPYGNRSKLKGSYPDRPLVTVFFSD